jgi:hypothetical protein
VLLRGGGVDQALLVDRLVHFLEDVAKCDATRPKEEKLDFIKYVMFNYVLKQ